MDEELDGGLHHGMQSVLPLLEGAQFVCEGVIVWGAANLLDLVQILHRRGRGVSKELLAICLHPIDRRLWQLILAKHHALVTVGNRRYDT